MIGILLCDLNSVFLFVLCGWSGETVGSTGTRPDRSQKQSRVELSRVELRRVELSLDLSTQLDQTIVPSLDRRYEGRESFTQHFIIPSLVRPFASDEDDSK